MKKGLLKKLLVAVTAMSMVVTVTNVAGVETYAATGAKKAVTAKKSAGKTTDGKNTSKTVKKADAESKLCGDWTYVCVTSEYTSFGETSEYFNMGDENGYASYEMSIYKDGDTLRADYNHIGESLIQLYGMPTEICDGAMDEKCENKEWYAEFKPRWESNCIRTLTLISENVLELREEMINDEYTEEDYRYVDRFTFVRKGSNEEKNKEDFRYLKTVKVSTAKELLEALESRTKIILEDGVYDMSNLAEEGIKNEHVLFNYGSEPQIEDINNVTIVADEGADVLIEIDDPYSRVLSFVNCNALFFEGLTMGHDVEPGTCSGSVLYMEGCSGGAVTDCDLYGCGTYGLELLNVSGMKISGTNIHDCSYGLVDLYNVYNMTFEDCSFMDSVEYSMFSVYDSYEVQFNDCLISGNVTDSNYSTFIDATDTFGLVFSGCTFEDNTYDELYQGEVEFEDCSFDDN